MGELELWGVVIHAETRVPMPMHPVGLRGFCGVAGAVTDSQGRFRFNISGSHAGSFSSWGLPGWPYSAEPQPDSTVLFVLPRPSDPTQLAPRVCGFEGGTEVLGVVRDTFSLAYVHSSQVYSEQLYLEDQGCGALSDSLGRFRFSGLRPGDGLFVHMIGYEDKWVRLDREGEAGHVIEVLLKPKRIVLDQISVGSR